MRQLSTPQWVCFSLGGECASLSIPLQYTLRSSLTVFAISQRDEVLRATGHPDKVAAPSQSTYNSYEAVLRRLLELDAKEFELLVSELLRALGFEGSEHTGRTGDGGVDARGELNVGNLAKVKIFVQAKRYRLGTRIAANTVRQLRQSIPSGAQGAFVTTADFHKDAFAVALETGFPRIGLINGSQLVDLLVLHWEKLGDEFRVRLGLKPGLVPA